MPTDSEQTWYQASARPFASLPPLEGKHEARVAIVGGGYAGVCLALGLAERGVRDVVLLEREGIGHGASGCNGGFVFAGYSLESRGRSALSRQRSMSLMGRLAKVHSDPFLSGNGSGASATQHTVAYRAAQGATWGEEQDRLCLRLRATRR
ncbi:MAG TPA: FAD-dependent oxidoreductase [Rhodanobacteraceae bacterium]|nr:FAD-dependent oxidoreductase [Rhodanobacteraceae bacterium]